MRILIVKLGSIATSAYPPVAGRDAQGLADSEISWSSSVDHPKY